MRERETAIFCQTPGTRGQLTMALSGRRDLSSLQTFFTSWPAEPAANERDKPHNSHNILMIPVFGYLADRVANILLANLYTSAIPEDKKIDNYCQIHF